MTSSPLEAALSGIRSGLLADGVDLDVTENDEGVTVEIVISAEACDDCLLPAQAIEEVVTKLIRAAGDPRPIRVVDPRRG